LSVVKLEEMAARAAAETEAKAAAVDKTLPAPPVPSGKPLGHGEIRRLGAQDIFGKLEPFEQVSVGTNAEPEMVPRTPSLSALSLLRPPQRHDQLVFSSYAEQELGRMKEDSGLDALERRLVEQVGTRRHLPVPAVMADPPPAPMPAPVPVPGKGKGKGKAAPTAEELESADEVLGAGAAVNESAISSLALGAEEDFGGRNANASVDVLAGLEGEGEDVEGEDVDADADGRTQRLSKGAGASSGSERGTHKARSRKSAKSDSKDKEKDKEKKAKKKREVRDEEAVKLKRAAKGRVAEWLEKLAPEPEREPAVADAEAQQDTRSPPSLPPEPAPAPTPVPEPTVAAAPAPEPLVIVESKPNPRSSGFISVATLRRAPISLQPPPAPESAPTAPRNVPAAPRVANRYPPPSQVEMKYNVKSARGGRGGRVTAVASIWAEASKAGGASAPTQAAKAVGPAAKAKGNPAQPKAAAPKSNGNNKNVASTPMPASAPQAKPVKPTMSIVAPGATKAPSPRQPVRAAKDEDRRIFVGRGRPAAPAAAPAKVEKEDAPPPAAARVSRALFGLGVAAATPSSPALSSSIATPVLSSTASLAQPPGSRARTRVPTPTPPPSSSSPAASRSTPSPRPPPPPSQPQPQPAAAAGWRAPLVSGAGFKADLAFGQARLRDLIRRYQGQAA